ncbi:MAG: hypothetical protein Q4G61_09300 [Tissierellia bacterium]|nr:hypothetical protein [Tissierellia bacterium]
MPKGLDWEFVLKRGVLAIAPKYDQGIGDTTHILLFGGENLCVRRNILTVLKNLGKYYMLDLAECRRYYAEFLGRRKNLPMVYNEENIFVPVRTRQPIGKNDGAMSFVNYRFVQGVEDSDVIFTDGSRMESFSAHITISNNLRDAGHILKDLRQKAEKEKRRTGRAV